MADGLRLARSASRLHRFAPADGEVVEPGRKHVMVAASRFSTWSDRLAEKSFGFAVLSVLHQCDRQDC